MFSVHGSWRRWIQSHRLPSLEEGDVEEEEVVDGHAGERQARCRWRPGHDGVARRWRSHHWLRPLLI